MADNVAITAGTGTSIATDDVSGVQYQKIKIDVGGDGVSASLSNTNPMPIQDAGGSITIDGTVTANLSATDNAVLDDIALDTEAIKTAVEILDNAISGAEMQVDVVTSALPSGASTAANQTTIIGHVDGIETTLSTISSTLTTINTSTNGIEGPILAPDGAWPATSLYMGGTLRKDSPTAIATADGLAAPFETDTAGRLYVNGVGGTFPVSSVVAGTGATNLGKAIDSAVGATDTGVAALAIRDDALTTLTPAESDYVPLRVNSTGALHVTGAGGGTEYVVDDAAPAGPTGATWVMERDDAIASLTEIEGDWTNPRSDAKGALWTTIQDIKTPLGDSILDDTNDAIKVAVVSDSVGSTTDTEDGSVASGQSTVALVIGLPYVYNGTAWVRLAAPHILDDAAFTPGTTGVQMAGFEADETTTDSVDEGDGGAARMTLDRKVITTPYPHTAGGLAIFRSIDLDEGALEVVKASAGQVYGMWVTNTATATRFIKFYDATSGTYGTGTPVITIGVPGNATDDIAGNFGPGGMGVAFATGICVGAGTGVADADTGAPGANDIIVNIFYK